MNEPDIMVNTFLTSRDLFVSARSLDIKRLRKQIVEGYQIQRVILQVYHIASLEGIEVHKSILSIDLYYQAIEWVKDVAIRYRSRTYCYVIRRSGEVFRYDKTSLPLKLNKKDKYEVSGDHLIVWLKDAHPLGVISTSHKVSGKKRPYVFRESSILYPDEEIYKLGYINHPATLMWIGYYECLCSYIHVHKLVYIEKTKGDIEIPTTYYEGASIPWWLTDEFILSHKASLNNKDPFYNFDLGGYISNGYIWPSKLLKVAG